MVRIKHRYILFDILYPPTPPESNNSNTSRDEFFSFSESQQTALLQLHQSSPSRINTKSLLSAVRKSLQEYFGDSGAGRAGGSVMVKYFSNRTSTGILRCDREQSDLVVAALALVTRIEQVRVVVRCLHVSGTIKKCEEYSIDKTRELINVIRSNSRKVDDYISEMSEIKAVQEGNQEEEEGVADELDDDGKST